MSRMYNVLMLLVGIISVCGNAFSADSVSGPPAATSMVKLLSNLDSFDGKNVEVFGYLVLHGMPQLYLTKDHADGIDRLSSIPVVFDGFHELWPSSCLGKYVRIRGSFRRVDAFSLGLRDIKSVYVPDEERFCYSMQVD